MLSEEEKEQKKRQVASFASKVEGFKNVRLDMKNFFPRPSDISIYLEDTTSKSYKNTLRVKTKDIESSIPPYILQQYEHYQSKVDKILELFYNNFPLNYQDDEKVKMISDIKTTIIKLGKEIQK